MLEDALPTDQLLVAAALLDMLHDLTTTVNVTTAFIADVHAKTARVCDLLERDLPRTELSHQLHVIRHLPEQMGNWGSPASFW